jgi:hypothetical protein
MTPTPTRETAIETYAIRTQMDCTSQHARSGEDLPLSTSSLLNYDVERVRLKRTSVYGLGLEGW